MSAATDVECAETCDHDVRCEGRHEVPGEHWAWVKQSCNCEHLHVWTDDRPCDTEDTL